MRAFSLRVPSALPGPAELDYRLPSFLSLVPGQTGPTGFTQQQTPRSTPFESTRPAHAFGNVAVHAAAPVQTKLAVNRSGDRYEREAEAVADHVMRMPAGSAAPEPAAAQPAVSERTEAPVVQRLAAHIDPSLDEIEIRPEEQEGTPAPGEEMAQTLRPAGGNGGARSLSAAALRGGGGAPLETGARRFMETRFGADFSRVRVHADGQSASLNRALNARAFTHRADIWFGENEYRPDTPDGRRVLAHELTHVVQQGAARSALPIRQEVGGAVQRLGPLGRRTATRVYPWGGTGPSGDNHEVSTAGGSTVTAWRGYYVWKYPLLYWCHGHSLDSFYTHGYSVYSGRDMRQVVADEYTPVAPHLTRPGDIAVWTAGWDHSATFTTPVVSGGTLDPAASRLSTKNGQNPLTTMSLSGIAGIYGGTGVAVFRR